MRSHARVLVAVAVLASFFAFATSASAGFKFSAAFSGEGSGDGELDTPGRAAVEQSTGNLFVVDSGNNRVQVFAPNDSGTAGYLTQFGSGELSAPWGIAIDEDAGQTSVYVADAGNEEIVKYDSDEAATPTFTVDPSFTSPSKGSGPGQVEDFHAALAIDPTTHELLVADNANKRIARFEADGNPAGSFDGSEGAGSPGAFSGPIDLAVNSSGDVYVIDANGPNIGQQEGTSQALRYSASGEYEATLTPVGSRQRPATVALNPTSDEVIVSGQQDAVYENEAPTLYGFDSSDNPTVSVALEASAQYDTVSGLAAYGGVGGRLYVALDVGHYGSEAYGAPQIAAFAETAPPALDIAPVNTATISKDEAELNGSVDPNGKATDYHFEYSADGGSTWTPTMSDSAGSGESAVPVSAQLSGLSPNTAYEAKLVAESSDGPSVAGPVSFSTDPAPPVVTTLMAGQVDDQSAMLKALINPANALTTYYFEYGTNTSYGSRTPSHAEPVGSGSTTVTVTAALHGLQARTTYHYRVVAANATGTSPGLDQSFTTGATPAICLNGAIRAKQYATFLPECRAYEMVSPPDKEGTEVNDGRGIIQPALVQAAPEGGTVAYQATGAFGNVNSNQLTTQYVAERTSSGWASVGVGAPQIPSKFNNYYGVYAMSSDLTKAVVGSGVALTPDAVQGDGNVYLWDGATNTYALIATSPELRNPGNNPVQQGSADLSVVILQTTAQLDSEAAPEVRNVYRWTKAAGLQLVNRMSDGSVDPVGAETGAPEAALQGNPGNLVSADGSRQFFTLGGAAGQASEALFGTDGEGVIELSESQTGTPAPPKNASTKFAFASRDGSVVYFFSRNRLTTESPIPSFAPETLYRYNYATGKLTDLSSSRGESVATDGVGNFLGASEDGSYAYFEATSVLAPGAIAGANNLYAWHDGTLTFVSYPANGKKVSKGQASPNGMYLAYLEEGGDQSTVYLYDASHGTLSCASCPADSSTSEGRAAMAEMRSLQNQYMPRAVLDDGSVLFDTEEALLPEDVNGLRDVYQFAHGAVRLISTGRADADALIADATPDGRNVFFTTRAQLLPRDTDQADDLYVARIEGGFAEPGSGLPSCSGEGCQLPSAAPPSAGAASARLNGPGNVSPRRKSRCGRGRHRLQVKGKQRCAKKRHAKHRPSASRKSHHGGVR